MNINDLRELEHSSSARGIPIIGSAKGQWLLNFIKISKPKMILELGTANGYSGIILGSEGAELTTVDINPLIAEEARVNFQRFNIHAFIIIDNAVKVVKRWGAKLRSEARKVPRPKSALPALPPLQAYDLIFIDFAKHKYYEVLEDCIQLTKKGGYIIADNISMEGCRDFKEAVLHHPSLATEIIYIKDGMSVSKVC